VWDSVLRSEQAHHPGQYQHEQLHHHPQEHALLTLHLSLELCWGQGELRAQRASLPISSTKQFFCQVHQLLPLLQAALHGVEVPGETEAGVLLPLHPHPEAGQQPAQHPQPLQDSRVDSVDQHHSTRVLGRVGSSLALLGVQVYSPTVQLKPRELTLTTHLPVEHQTPDTMKYLHHTLWNICIRHHGISGSDTMEYLHQTPWNISIRNHGISVSETMEYLYQTLLNICIRHHGISVSDAIEYQYQTPWNICIRHQTPRISCIKHHDMKTPKFTNLLLVDTPS